MKVNVTQPWKNNRSENACRASQSFLAILPLSALLVGNYFDKGLGVHHLPDGLQPLIHKVVAPETALVTLTDQALCEMKGIGSAARLNGTYYVSPISYGMHFDTLSRIEQLLSHSQERLRPLIESWALDRSTYPDRRLLAAYLLGQRLIGSQKVLTQILRREERDPPAAAFCQAFGLSSQRLWYSNEPGQEEDLMRDLVRTSHPNNLPGILHEIVTALSDNAPLRRECMELLVLRCDVAADVRMEAFGELAAVLTLHDYGSKETLQALLKRLKEDLSREERHAASSGLEKTRELLTLYEATFGAEGGMNGILKLFAEPLPPERGDIARRLLCAAIKDDLVEPARAPELFAAVLPHLMCGSLQVAPEAPLPVLEGRESEVFYESLWNLTLHSASTNFKLTTNTLTAALAGRATETAYVHSVLDGRGGVGTLTPVFDALRGAVILDPSSAPLDSASILDALFYTTSGELLQHELHGLISLGLHWDPKPLVQLAAQMISDLDVAPASVALANHQHHGDAQATMACLLDELYKEPLLAQTLLGRLTHDQRHKVVEAVRRLDASPGVMLAMAWGEETSVLESRVSTAVAKPELTIEEQCTLDVTCATLIFRTQSTAAQAWVRQRIHAWAERKNNRGPSKETRDYILHAATQVEPHLAKTLMGTRIIGNLRGNEPLSDEISCVRLRETFNLLFPDKLGALLIDKWLANDLGTAELCKCTEGQDALRSRLDDPQVARKLFLFTERCQSVPQSEQSLGILSANLFAQQAGALGRFRSGLNAFKTSSACPPESRLHVQNLISELETAERCRFANLFRFYNSERKHILDARASMIGPALGAKVITIFIPYHDHNGAFLAVNSQVRELRAKGYTVLLYEIGGVLKEDTPSHLLSLEEAIQDAKKMLALGSFTRRDVILNIHGSRWGGDLRRPVTKEDLLELYPVPYRLGVEDEASLQAMNPGELVSNGGTFYTLACSPKKKLGSELVRYWHPWKKHNFLQTLAGQFPHARVVGGAEDPTRYRGTKFDDEGNFIEILYDVTGASVQRE